MVYVRPAPFREIRLIGSYGTYLREGVTMAFEKASSSCFYEVIVMFQPLFNIHHYFVYDVVRPLIQWNDRNLKTFILEDFLV